MFTFNQKVKIKNPDLMEFYGNDLSGTIKDFNYIHNNLTYQVNLYKGLDLVKVVQALSEEYLEPDNEDIPF